MTNNDGLAIELTWKNGERRLLLSTWAVANVGEHGDHSFWVVKASCGCWSDVNAYQWCESHVGAWRWRLVDARRPSGPFKWVR